MKSKGIEEIDDAFYQRYESLGIRLAEAERDLVIYSEGLSVIEKKLMVKADNAFFRENNKRQAEALQRRDAKADPEYMKVVRAKAKAQESKTLYKVQLELMKMKFEGWRTRSADRRNSM